LTIYDGLLWFLAI